jgi:hypothetical protein
VKFGKFHNILFGLRPLRRLITLFRLSVNIESVNYSYVYSLYGLNL